MKYCTKCKINKNLIEFSKSKASKDGLYSQCKSCNKQYSIDNKEKIKQRSAKSYLNNIDKKKQYRLDNKEKIKQSKREYNIRKRNEDSLYKLSGNIRSLICVSIKNKGYSKKSKTNEILGCDFEIFKLHLQKQFTKGMSWKNQGEWHLDHIYPVSLAKDEKHLIELNHYTNFQPLWAIDNLSKGNKIKEKQLFLI